MVKPEQRDGRVGAPAVGQDPQGEPDRCEGGALMGRPECTGCGSPAERKLTLTDVDGVVLDARVVCVSCLRDVTIERNGMAFDGADPVSVSDIDDAKRRVNDALAAYKLASKRLMLSKKPASEEARRQEMKAAERAYREASAHRDALVGRMGSR